MKDTYFGGKEMTVSELIKELSALEKQEQEIYARGNNCFIVSIKSITEFSGDGMTGYVLTDGEPLSEEKAINGLLEYSGNKTT